MKIKHAIVAVVSLLLAPVSLCASAGEKAAAKDPREVLVTVRGSRPGKAFFFLRAAGGPEVVCLCRRYVLVPGKLRGRPVMARELIEGIARMHGLRASWAKKGKVVVLERGTRIDDVKLMEIALNTKGPAERRKAVVRAAWFEDHRAIPALVKACSDKDPETAYWAEWTLRHYGLKAAALIGGEAARPVLEKALLSRSDVLKREAVRGLARLGGEKSAAKLQELLKTWKTNHPARPALLEALGRMGLKLAHLRNEGEAAAMGAGLNRSPGCRAVVRGLINYGEASEVVGTVAEATGDAELLAAVIKTLEGGGSGRPEIAAKILAESSAPKARAALVKALEAKDKRVQFAAACSLAPSGNARALELLKKKLKDQRDSFLALEALGRCGHVGAVRILEGAYKHADGRAISADGITSALGEIGSDEAVQALGHRLSALTPKNRQLEEFSLYLALGQTANEKALKLIGRRGCLKSSTHAIKALGRFGNETAVNQLTAIYRAQPRSSFMVLDAFGETGSLRARAAVLRILGGRPAKKAGELSALSRTGHVESFEKMCRAVVGEKGKPRNPIWPWYGMKLLNHAVGPSGRDAYAVMVGEIGKVFSEEQMISALKRSYPDDPKCAEAVRKLKERFRMKHMSGWDPRPGARRERPKLISEEEPD